MRVNLFILPILLFVTSCKKNDDNASGTFTENKIDLTTHKLASFSIVKNSNYLVVFESGLGDGHSVWTTKNIITEISKSSDVLLYDRAGYGESEAGPAPRNIEKLRAELDSVINKFSNERKVILVGHSLGGMIIRDYAIKNPGKTAAILFVDPSHEFYNQPSQSDEDMIFNSFKNAYGANSGGAMEARELIEDSQYMGSLPNLPNIPVIVLTSLKVGAGESEDDKEIWYNAHELLKNGITDFTHITTTNSGHYIMGDEPNLVIENIELLIAKLP